MYSFLRRKYGGQSDYLLVIRKYAGQIAEPGQLHFFRRVAALTSGTGMTVTRAIQAWPQTL